MSDHDHSTAATPFLNDLRFEYVIRNVGVTLGITVLRSELFVLHSDPNLVNVYNFTHNFTHTRNITINGTSNDPDVHSLVSSQSNNCLYACSSASVYQYNLFDDVTTNWPVSGKCRGLSLASNDNVLVTVWDKERIEEYAHSGRWIREIRLERSIVHPSHSVQLSRGQFVVSHGFIDETIHRVCAVSEDVRIIKCAGDKKGSDTGQFDIPNSLAVDRHGRVLVADYTNNRVALLSRSLSHLGYVSIPGFEFERPWVLHLDELKRRLYVGEYTPTGRVFVLAV